MKKILILILLVTISATIHPINFELWNKTSSPVYFELGTEKNPPKGEDLTPINAFGKKDTLFKKSTRFKVVPTFVITAQRDYAQSNIDIRQKEKTVILLSNIDTNAPAKPGALITIKPGKDIILEIKEDARGQKLFTDDNRRYAINPQAQKTAGYSERDLRLKFNVVPADITVVTEEQNKSKKSIEKELKSRIK